MASTRVRPHSPAISHPDWTRVEQVSANALQLLGVRCRIDDPSRSHYAGFAQPAGGVCKACERRETGARDTQATPDADEWSPAGPPFELGVRSFGLEDGVGEDLLQLVRAWDASGLGEDRLRVAVYPHDVDVVPAGSERVIATRWTRLVLDWT
jgi:hypothetical protein